MTGRGRPVGAQDRDGHSVPENVVVGARSKQMGNCTLEAFLVLLDSAGMNHFMNQRYLEVIP